MTKERTFALVKPDGVQRGLIGEVLSRFERKGLKVVAMKLLVVTEDLAKSYYSEHIGKAFFEPLIRYITSGPSVAMVLEGDEAVAVVRKMMGKTSPIEADPGTIRGDFGLHIGRNIIHGSDSLTSAEREMSLFFSSDEIVDFERTDEQWLYGE
ncbi:MAG: nucleoside-diphosphate kinase [Methanomassiliicoccales archaeon]|nr:MAG: nucleoside-diphosphate kinase [Methanomassiliicoccales archaeon]